MSESEADIPSDLLQLLAREEVETIRLTRSTLLEQHSHLFKWLTASLLAVNAGAAVALLNATTIAPLSKIIPGAMFGAGLFFALLPGVINQRAMLSSINQLQQRLGYWIAVEYLGERNLEDEAKHQVATKHAEKLSLWARIASWASAIMFFGGYILCGFQLEFPSGNSAEQVVTCDKCNETGGHLTSND